VPVVTPLFRIVCEGIESVPEERNPLIPIVAVAVHVKVVPMTFEVKLTSVVEFSEQTVSTIGLFVTIGLGFTVITLLFGVPLHPPVEGMRV
jgi:hypothetical protein